MTTSSRPGHLSGSVAGLGPHGEFAAPADQLVVSADDAERARAHGYAVALVMHTTTSDWSRQQIAGIRETLADFGAALIEVVDCEFRSERQVEVLGDLVRRRPDAIISIPVHNAHTADAHRAVGEAGIKLVLMDNAPVGLVARKHYVTVVSADNFGNGQIGAELLSPYLPQGGTAGVIGFGVDFFVTNEREIAFRKWMADHRPDVRIRQDEFVDIEAAGEVAYRMTDEPGGIDGLFVAWDVPAMSVVRTLHETRRSVPLTTVDLGLDAATEMIKGGLIKGLAAQRPYDLGVAEATAAIMALVGDEPPPWVAVPGFPVTRETVVRAYESVWHASAPASLTRELGV